MSPRRDRSPLGSPILIGALTVLAVIVAVFLAYNANNGLPFVPSYTLHVQVADANELTHGAEVHMGGALVGFVDGVQPSRTQNGRPIALLALKLNRSIGRLPVDSTFTVRLKGSIGQKYLAVGLGRSRHTLADGATVPERQTGATVDLDQVLSMFDPPTRRGVTASTIGFSDGLAGRGTDVNQAIGAFVPLLTHLRPVARNLASSHTGWIELRASSSRVAVTVIPSDGSMSGDGDVCASAKRIDLQGGSATPKPQLYSPAHRFGQRIDVLKVVSFNP